ncbi:MAG: hypothetical protein GX589_04935 [Deltaproteobacteria bacterium]|nr:hypothetical protein [Deltaproteobacteria bacterium]
MITRCAAAVFLALGVGALSARAETLEDLLVRKGVISREEVAQVGPKVTYNKGTKIDFADEKVGVGILTLVQPRYQFTDNARESGKDNTSSFQFKRARLYLSGYALEREFTYTLMTDFVGTTDSNGASSPNLQDAFIEYHPESNWDMRIGQFLVPFVRESLLAYTQQFPDFSAAAQNFAVFRQPGAGVWYHGDDKKFTLGASVYNGNSTGEGMNRPGVDTKQSAVVNARWSPLAPINVTEEGDISCTPEPAVSVGASYRYAQNKIAQEEDKTLSDSNVNAYNVDLNFKYMGFSVHGEFMGLSRTGDFENSNPLGMYAQVGYFIMPQRFELAGRYSTVECDNGGTSQCSAETDRINEVSAGGNYFFSRSHTLKMQLAWIWRKDEMKGGGEDLDTSKVILQFSSAL